MSELRRRIGHRIREFRRRVRWEQKELAQRINRLDARARCDGNMVSRWELGRNLPGPFYQELICEAFSQADDSLLGGRVPTVDRRAFIRNTLGFGALTLVAAESGLPWERIEHALERPGRIDEHTVDGLERVTVGLERLEQQVGPLELIGPAVGHLEAIGTMLRQSMPSRLRPQLCSIAAETAGLVAIAKAQAGQAQGAAAYLETALRLAGEANDRALGAWLMGRYTGSQPAYRDDPELRLRHVVSGAFGFCPHEATPTVQSWFAAKAADVYGLLGRPDDCLRALDRAERACTFGRCDEPAPRPRHAFCGLGEAWLAAERGASLTRIGQTDAARASIARALCLAGDDLGRVSLWLTLAQARAHLHDRQLDEACRLAAEVVSSARQLHFDLLVVEVRSLHSNDLAPWASEPAVVALGDHLGSRV